MKWVRASARFGAFGGEPGHRRLAKCDAGSSRTGGFFPPRRGFSALLRDLPARWRNTGFFGSAAHTPRSRGAKPHTAATRASRRGAGSLPADRVDRVDVSHGGKIGTIDPFQADEALSVALSKRD